MDKNNPSTVNYLTPSRRKCHVGTRTCALIQAMLQLISEHVKDETPPWVNEIYDLLHQNELIDESWKQSEWASDYWQLRQIQWLTNPVPLTLSGHLTDISYYGRHFTEIEKIGGGAFGKVFKAKHNIDGRTYAIKKVKSCHFEEAIMMAGLNHPNIVQYKTAWLELENNNRHESNADASSDDDSSSCDSRLSGGRILYIQMALCRCSLADWMQQRHDNKSTITKAQRRETAEEIFIQLLRALTYLHSKNIIHHDIKPGNILIADSHEFVVQLSDFGLGCLSNCTPLDYTKGTRLYAAPEQLERKCNVKSDMYSLGIVVFEILEDFGTVMERCKKIEELRNQMSVTVLVKDANKWERENTLDNVIPLLMTNDPVLRPDAAVLLQNFENRRSRPSYKAFNLHELSRTEDTKDR